MAGTHPIQARWGENIPYFAPLAAAPINSYDPMLAATKAKPVVVASKERPERKKSSLLWTFFLVRIPM